MSVLFLNISLYRSLHKRSNNDRTLKLETWNGSSTKSQVDFNGYFQE